LNTLQQRSLISQEKTGLWLERVLMAEQKLILNSN